MVNCNVLKDKDGNLFGIYIPNVYYPKDIAGIQHIFGIKDKGIGIDRRKIRKVPGFSVQFGEHTTTVNIGDETPEFVWIKPKDKTLGEWKDDYIHLAFKGKDRHKLAQQLSQAIINLDLAIYMGGDRHKDERGLCLLVVSKADPDDILFFKTYDELNPKGRK